MIKDKQFFYEMIRKYTAIVLGLFKHVHYFSYENEEAIYKPLNVNYAQGEKYIKDIINKIDTDQNIARTLPVMCISLKDLKPNPEIRRNPYTKLNKRCGDESISISPPIPYKFIFEVSLISKKTGVGTSVIEQILPYFTPDFTISAKEINDFNIINDVVISLQNPTIKIDEEYTTQYNSTKYFLSTFTLELRGNLYKPISESGIIENVYITVRNYKDEVDLDNNDILIEIHTSKDDL